MEANQPEHRKRLAEIAGMKFAELSDEEALRLLAERKHLEEVEKKYVLLEKEGAKLNKKEAEKAALEVKLSELNKLISPEKPDDELLHLVKERREIETSLDIVQAEIASLKKEIPAETAPKNEEESKEEKEEPAEIEKVAPEPVSAVSVKQKLAEEKKSEPESEVEDILVSSGEFGSEKIAPVALTNEQERYIDQMKNSPNSLGTILDSLPQSVKQDKKFMLAVAGIDPAYAMHYADAATLKKDEDFNMRVAGMKNERHSGNALSEMSAEGRTSRVILEGVKNDYKNIRFALPNMPEYDAMLEIAKKGALEAVRKLKNGVDVKLLVPKILQKDGSFMEQVEKIIGEGKA